MSTVSMPGPYRLTCRDWLEFPETGYFYEIIDGELFVTPAPSIEHQRLSRDLQFRLLEHLRHAGAGEILNAPVGVKLRDDVVLEPDLLIIKRDSAARISEQLIDGAPDVVIEILSPGSARRDLGIKRSAYEAAGVTEYWIVDPESESIEVLVLDRGSYARHGLFRRGDALTSPGLPSFSLALSELFVYRR